MLRILLFAIICLFAVSSNATFELEDPAEPGKENIKPREGSLFKKWQGKDQVIVAPGTALYVLVIDNRRCTGWLPDESEPYLGTTYMGTLLSKIDCSEGSEGKQFTLVQTQQGRMLWVESGKVLPAN
jgi:hypothetical protein